MVTHPQEAAPLCVAASIPEWKSLWFKNLCACGKDTHIHIWILEHSSPVTFMHVYRKIIYRVFYIIYCIINLDDIKFTVVL